MSTKPDFTFLHNKAPIAAPQLLGSILYRRIGDKLLSARIVETEAYDETDAASHSFNGETKRTSVMFGPAGLLYVYFTYGMHYCCNVVVGQLGEGSAVLIRAVEPIDGLEEMSSNRHGRLGNELTNGPAKLCQALLIDLELNGHNLLEQPLLLMPTKSLPAHQVIHATRIGISKAKSKKWRFYIKNNAFVSNN